ncbi:AAA-domain-containing protein [Amniculicola lignicola CBS 123094]|uniref:AAA-domain-containing protein n=1 Tax=Amniculicola lignicola CBS 123094 TaxID=1392246 RepID=A0A6A5WG29_9PLEO|nr:AAA-domain-containing protein [Amniculicola lignicola CBS 123094]
MYAAIRPALRSASRPPARFIHRRRYPLSSRVRLFHSTRFLARNPTTPPDPTNTPADENGGNEKSREGAVAAQDNEATPEDAEIIAQKLQRSKEMTRRYSSALKRTQRRNRAQDLPAVHIPQWFTDRRITLREDYSMHQQAAPAISLSIRNSELGEHGTVSIPFWNYKYGVAGMAELVHALWAKDLAPEGQGAFARHCIRRHEATPEERFWEFLQGKLGNQPSEGTEEQSQEAKDKALRKHSKLALNRDRAGRTLSSLALAEIRAAMAASLSAVHTASNDSFPTAKTNLILHGLSKYDWVMLDTVYSIAADMGADVIALSAQDLAELLGDYLGEGPEPSPHSVRSLGYETYKMSSELANDVEDLAGVEPFDEELDSSQPIPSPIDLSKLSNVKVFHLPAGLKSLNALSQNLKNMAGMSQGDNSSNLSDGPQRTLSQSETQLEDLKITNVLETLVDANDLKRDNRPSHSTKKELVDSNPVVEPNIATPNPPKFFDFSLESRSVDLELDFSPTADTDQMSQSNVTVTMGPARESRLPQKSKIILVRDIKELNATQYGSRILQKLEEVVRRRRSAGENIMIVGITCSMDLVPELSAAGVKALQAEGESSFFRTIAITPYFGDSLPVDVVAKAKAIMLEKKLGSSEKSKFKRINLRHIQDMLKRLDPEAAKVVADRTLGPRQLRTFGRIFPESYSWEILSYDEVHRIALTALGLHLMDPSNAHLTWAHVALAMGLLKASDASKFAWMRFRSYDELKPDLSDELKEHIDKVKESLGQKPRVRIAMRRKPGDAPSKPLNEQALKRQKDLERIAQTATKHEKRLMHGIVNPDQIKTTFDQIHVPKETVESIRTLTSMSLLRPDAFNYGVLATDKISGVLLYGPPGTGKTLLAKAVAKESGSNVLEISGSEIMDKYVGEGEKNVSAIFSLARKLSPCLVFLDEADSIFGSRNESRLRVSHRDILNQFLKEWDGLNDVSVFVMVATNRPFDMDDAVIRRLPRRLLVDLPTQEDRHKILQIHLRDEQLDSSVDLEDLSKRTPFYSGSDLKNIAVSAALACVKEENEQAAMAALDAAKAAAETAATASPESPSTSPTPDSEQSPKPDSKPAPPPTPTPSAPPSPPTSHSFLMPGVKYDFPDKRTLSKRHFDKALHEISASISEDMSSLKAMQKFDEQYGDRKGRKKKNTYGFGVGIKEGAAERDVRVRG